MRIFTDHKKLSCIIYNNDRVLIWRPIIEEYGTDIECIKGEKNIVAEALSILTINSNQETTQESTHRKEIVSEIIDNKELPEGDFTINFKIINQYQQKNPRLKTKYEMVMYQRYSFRGGININLNLITWFDKIVILSRFKSYVLP